VWIYNDDSVDSSIQHPQLNSNQRRVLCSIEEGMSGKQSPERLVALDGVPPKDIIAN
jgi:hypothetical protein